MPISLEPEFDFKKINYKSFWLLSETKLRAFDLENFLKKNYQKKKALSLTRIDAFLKIASLLGIEKNSQDKKDSINLCILDLILDNPEFNSLKKELSFILEEESQNLSFKNLNYLLSSFKNFTVSLQAQQNIDAIIKKIIDDAGNTLEQKQNIEELIQLNNLLFQESINRNIADEISLIDQLLLELNTNKNITPNLPEAIIVDTATSFAPLELEILLQLSSHCKVEILIKEHIYNLAEKYKIQDFKELLNSLAPSEKQYANLVFFYNRFKDRLNFIQIPALNSNAEPLMAALFDAATLPPDYQFELPLSIWQNSSAREEVKRVANCIANIVKNKKANLEDIHIICLALEEYQGLFEEIFSQYKIEINIPRGRKLRETLVGSFYLIYLDWFFNPNLESLEKLIYHNLFTTKDNIKAKLDNIIRFAKKIGLDDDLFLNPSWPKYFQNHPSLYGDMTLGINWIKNELTENNILQNEDSEFPKKIFSKINKYRYRYKKNDRNINRRFLALAINNTKNILKNLSDLTFDNKSSYLKLGFDRKIILQSTILEKLKEEALPLAYKANSLIISEILDSRGLQGKFNFVLGLNSTSFPASSHKQLFTNEIDELSNKIKEASNNNSAIYESYSLIGNLFRESKELVLCFPEILNNHESKPAEFLLPLAKYISQNKHYNSPKILSKYERELELELAEKLTAEEEKSLIQLRSKKVNYFTEHDGLIGETANKIKFISEQSYSSSTLETFADCPHKFFFQHILTLKEDEESISKTLAVETGILIHHSLKELFSNPKFKVITEDNFNAAQKELLSIANSFFEKNSYNWDLNEQWRQSKRNILQGLEDDDDKKKRGILKAALAYSRDLINSVPHELEWDFRNILIDSFDNKKISLQGRIDRIDRENIDLDSDIAAVFDYKTGKATAYKEVEKGKSLQLAIYALAVKQNLSPNKFPKRAAIFSLKNTNRRDEDLSSFHKGVLIEHLAIQRAGNRLVPNFDAGEGNCNKIVEIIKSYDQQIRNGEFYQKLETDSCFYCDFKNICQRDERLIKIKNENQILSDEILEQNRGPEYFEYINTNKAIVALSQEQEEACDINQNIALIAAAGSGKTTVLTRRILKLILNGEDILSIVAITYTEKAAEEIKQRLSSDINSILEENIFEDTKLNAEQKKRLLIAKTLLPLSPIGTIHAFASIILRLDPIVADSPFSMNIITGEDRNKLLKQAIVKALKNNSKNLTTKLLELGLNWKNLERNISHFLLFPRELFLLNNSFQNEKIISELISRFENKTLNEQGLEISKIFCELCNIAYQNYQRLKKDSSSFDFEDLIINAHNCLIKNTSERANKLRIRARSLFRHFLLDEFQDTDLYQWEIIKTLCPSVFNKQNLEFKQSLLIVGDPQQAIYGFRGGDSTVFKQAIDEITKAGGKLHFLRNNYRSNQDLINFFNIYFEELFSCDFNPSNEARVSTATRYEEMQALKNNEEEGNVSILLNPPESEIEEARYLVNHLKENILPNTKHKDIAILCRKNIHLQEIAKELEEQNIDFSLGKSNNTFELEEIKQFENLLKYLLNQQDSISLVGSLRSTIFGLSDKELLLLFKELDENWDNIFNINNNSNFFYIKEKISHWKHLSKSLSTSQLLKAIISEQGLSKIYRHNKNYTELKNINNLIDILATEEKLLLLEPNIRSALHWIKLKRSNNFQFVNISENSKISLMTIHNAKGLEFDLVILPFIDYTLKPEHDFIIGEFQSTKLLGIKVEDEDDSFNRTKTPIQEFIQETAKALTAAEERRLFYVACTRAKRELIISLELKKSFVTNQKKFQKMSLTERKDLAFIKNTPYYWLEALFIQNENSLTLANPLKSLSLPFSAL